MGSESPVQQHPDGTGLDVPPSQSTSPTAWRRERLLGAIALMGGVGLMLALPFALQAGAEFFLPVTAALIVAIALVPLLEWLERRGLPSPLAALLCVTTFLVGANGAMATVILPAIDWVAMLPERMPRIRANLGPIIDIYSDLEHFIDDTVAALARSSSHTGARVMLESPNSLFDLVTSSAPVAIIQVFFAVLLIYFFLSGWTRMRRRTITNRNTYSSAMTTARVIQGMVDMTSTYLATITGINFTLGCLVALVLWLFGMPSPVMWGGLVAILNYIPYLGPIVGVVLLGFGGLMTFADPWCAFAPAAMFIGVHLFEANLVTPLLVGRRLTISPLLILVSLSYWGWVWGAVGALLAVPILIIVKTILDAAGKPDIAGFLFGEGTLTAVHDTDDAIISREEGRPA